LLSCYIVYNIGVYRYVAYILDIVHLLGTEKKRTYIISQKDSVFLESESRKGKKENLSGGPFINP